MTVLQVLVKHLVRLGCGDTLGYQSYVLETCLFTCILEPAILPFPENTWLAEVNSLDVSLYLLLSNLLYLHQDMGQSRHLSVAHDASVEIGRLSTFVI